MTSGWRGRRADITLSYMLTGEEDTSVPARIAMLTCLAFSVAAGALPSQRTLEKLKFCFKGTL